MSGRRVPSPASRSLMIGLSSLYAYIYCLLASNELTAMPIFGGAMYMCGQVSSEFFATALGPQASLLPKSLRRWKRVILALLLIMSIFLMIIYPMQLSSFQLWTVLVIVLGMLLRDELSRRLIRMRTRGGLRTGWYAGLLAAVHVLPALAILWDFLFNLSPARAWTMFAAYGIEDALALYMHLSEMRDNTSEGAISEADVQRIEELQQMLGEANTFKVYQTLSTAIIISLVMTLTLMYTDILLLAEDMILQMALTVGTTLLTWEAAQSLLNMYVKRKGREPNPTYLMLLGLLLWFSGLNSFRSLMRSPGNETTGVYLCLVIISGGATLSMVALTRMEGATYNVARFKMGNQLSGFSAMRNAQIGLARLMGEMIALVILTILFYLQDPRNLGELLQAFRPALLVPVLIMIIISIICAFRYPLSKYHMDKLDRVLHLREKGVRNRALESQMEQIALQEHRQPFGTAIIKAVVRVFYRHKIIGRENIVLDDDNPLVFLCNHGNLYGPIACAANFPVPMRPWVISQICVDVDEFAAYFNQYTLCKYNIPEQWKMPIAHFVGKLSMWCMRQLEVIPVYRDSPMELIKTFRASVEALQAGDNLLIFPENPNAIEQDHGYEAEGLGPLFEGFTMLATIYYKRTHKACRFLPMYAHQATRTLSFGHEVVFHPEAEDQEAERMRVVQACEMEMHRLYEEQEQVRKQKSRRKM